MQTILTGHYQFITVYLWVCNHECPHQLPKGLQCRPQASIITQHTSYEQHHLQQQQQQQQQQKLFSRNG
jgi:hypothetical protein